MPDQVFNEFMGLGLAGDKRIYGSQYAEVANNVIVMDGIIEPRSGQHYLSSQKASQINAIGIQSFNSSGAKSPNLVVVGNYNSSNAAIVIFKSRRKPGKVY